MSTASLDYHRTAKQEKSAYKGVPRRAPSTSTLRGGVVQTSIPVELQCKLDLPRIVWIIARGSDFAEGRTGL